MSRRSLTDLAGRPRRADVGLMLMFLVPSIAQVLLEPIASRPVGVVFALGSVLPLAWRRANPVVAALVGTAVWLIPTDGFLYLGYVIAVVLFFSVGACQASITAVAVVAAWASTLGVLTALDQPEPQIVASGTLLVVLAPTVAGRLVANQRSQTARLQELTARLQDERASAERTAVAEERTRIARELHDVVGHDVTVIALQAEAAAAAIGTAPDLARAPIDVIRGSAHQALREMRRVLTGLRETESESGLHPQPGIDDVLDLVERARAVGDDVDLDIQGANATASASVGLGVYRIVQEALTNARKHAPGAPVRIRIISSAHGVEVRVTNPSPPADVDSVPGFGLVGMQERVRLLGGRLRTGFDESAHFSVDARLPYDVGGLP